jgi:hypothetical protein
MYGNASAAKFTLSEDLADTFGLNLLHLEITSKLLQI